MLIAILIGALLGYLIGGPIGLLIGGGLGYWLIQRLKKSLIGKLAGAQAQFLESTFAVMGCMCKADGQVTEDELEASRQLLQGAQVLDLGAQSTRPGAEEVGAEEECRRLLEPLRRIRRRHQHLLHVQGEHGG